MFKQGQLVMLLSKEEEEIDFGVIKNVIELPQLIICIDWGKQGRDFDYSEQELLNLIKSNKLICSPIVIPEAAKMFWKVI